MKIKEFAPTLLLSLIAAALALPARAASPIRFDQGLELGEIMKEARERARELPSVPGAASAAKALADPTSPWQSAVDACQPKPPVSNASQFVGAYKSCFQCQIFTYILDFKKTQVGMQCRAFPPQDSDYEWRWENRTRFTGVVYAPGPDGVLTALKVYEHYWERVRRERPDRDRPDRNPGGGHPGGGRPGDGDRPDRDRPERDRP